MSVPLIRQDNLQSPPPSEPQQSVNSHWQVVKNKIIETLSHSFDDEGPFAPVIGEFIILAALASVIHPITRCFTFNNKNASSKEVKLSVWVAWRMLHHVEDPEGSDALSREAYKRTRSLGKTVLIAIFRFGKKRS